MYRDLKVWGFSALYFFWLLSPLRALPPPLDHAPFPPLAPPDLEKTAPPSAAKHQLIVEQRDSPTKVCSTAAYMVAPEIYSKTFLAPQITLPHPQEPQNVERALPLFRKYLYTLRLDKEGKEHQFYRAYDFFKPLKEGLVFYPHQVPICTVEGLERFDPKSGAVLEFKIFPDATRLASCNLPPSARAGEWVEIEKNFYRTAPYLYTVHTPAGTFANCQLVCSYGPQKSLTADSRLAFYAPRLGVVLDLNYDPPSHEFRPTAILAAYEKDSHPTPERTPLAFNLHLYLASPQLREKLFSVPLPPALKAQKVQGAFLLYQYAPPQWAASQKVDWQRRDLVTDPQNPQELRAAPQAQEGVDYIDAETQALVRLYKQEGLKRLALQIPPLASAGHPYQFEGRWYQLDPQLYRLNTKAGPFETCLRVTYFGAQPGVLGQGSYRAYFAPQLGEVGREDYDPQTEKFTISSNLWRYQLGAAAESSPANPPPESPKDP